MDEFIEALEAEVDKKLDEMDDPLVRAVFAQMKENSEGKITLTGFGKAMQWYGPMKNGTRFVLHENVRHFISNTFYSLIFRYHGWLKRHGFMEMGVQVC